MPPRAAAQIVLRLPRDPTLSPLVRLAATHFLRFSGIAAGRARRLAGSVEKSCRADLRPVATVGSGEGPGLALALRATADLCEALVRSGRGRTWRSLLRVPRPPAA